ncbi:MAG TPA: hypothetical protein VEC12_00505 [Bacteroidia bacterium]|nr:hypothetical protein [Bacteroidia bacterium]
MATQAKQINKTAAIAAVEGIKLPVNKISADNIANISNLLAFAQDGFLEYHFESDGDVDFALPVDITNKEVLQALSIAFPGAADFISRLNTAVEIFNPRNVENIWLEFDTSSPDFKGVPSIYFDLHRAHYLYLNFSQSDSFWKNWLDESIAVVGTKNLIPENIAAMQNCIQKLSTAGYPAYAAVMKGRDEQLRLSMKILDNSALFDFLKDIGIQLVAEDGQKMAALVSMADFTAVNLDFENGSITPQFGIELHISKNEEHDTHEEQLFAALQSYSLCTAEQKAQILAWPVVREDDNGITAFQRISHVKITVNQGKIDCTKAYLYYLYNNSLAE